LPLSSAVIRILAAIIQQRAFSSLLIAASRPDNAAFRTFFAASFRGSPSDSEQDAGLILFSIV
jgi:hypothetical protein